MNCNCESFHCPICKGEGCHNQAGKRKAMYVGAVCDNCAQHTPVRYMLPEVRENTHISDPNPCVDTSLLNR